MFLMVLRDRVREGRCKGGGGYQLYWPAGRLRSMHSGAAGSNFLKLQSLRVKESRAGAGERRGTKKADLGAWDSL